MPDFAERYTDVRDRTRWPEGPWTAEPEDKVVWVDPETDLDCMAVRNQLGAWCGYVGVAPGHRLHGADYEAAHDAAAVDVHGGLTFADRCAPSGKGPQEGICHIEQDGRPDPVWWFGFDCAHAWDVVPGLETLGVGSDAGGAYRDLGFVVAECETLARQLAA